MIHYHPRLANILVEGEKVLFLTNKAAGKAGKVKKAVRDGWPPDAFVLQKVVVLGAAIADGLVGDIRGTIRVGGD